MAAARTRSTPHRRGQPALARRTKPRAGRQGREGLCFDTGRDPLPDKVPSRSTGSRREWANEGAPSTMRAHESRRAQACSPSVRIRNVCPHLPGGLVPRIPYGVRRLHGSECGRSRHLHRRARSRGPRARTQGGRSSEARPVLCATRGAGRAVHGSHTGVAVARTSSVRGRRRHASARHARRDHRASAAERARPDRAHLSDGRHAAGRGARGRGRRRPRS